MPVSMTSAVESGGTKNGIVLSGAVRAVYSRDVLFHAQPSLVFAQFVDRQTELQREPGDTIKFTKYHDLRGKTKLSEVENMGVTHLAAHQVAIQVDEHGFAVGESNRLLATAWDNIMGRTMTLLGQHYGRTVDSLLRDQFISAGSLQMIMANPSAANRAALGAADLMNVQAIKDGNEILAIEKAPKINGSYVCIVHPHQARGLRDDSEWIEAHKYTQPGVNNIYRGEIGMMDGVRFIETTHTSIIKASTGVVSVDGEDTEDVEALANDDYDVYQAPLFGANAIGWAEALPVEVRDNGVIDFQRTRQIGWYSIMGAGQIREENVTLIETT